MGYPGPFVNAPPSEISEQVVETTTGIRNRIEAANSNADVFLAIASVTADISSDEQLYQNPSDIQENHFGQTVFEDLVALLDDIDRLGGTDYHDEINEFAEQLDQQEFIADVTGLLLAYALSDEDTIISYVNSYIQQVVPTWNELIEISHVGNPHPNELLDHYRKWGSLAEDAFPPVVALIQHLDNGEVKFEEVRSLSLSNYVDIIESFDPLSSIGANLDPNIRNSASHGGATGGPDINPINQTIDFTYEVGDTDESRTMTYGEFKQHTFETMGAVTALFVLPFYLVAIHSSTKIGDWAGKAENGNGNTD